MKGPYSGARETAIEDIKEDLTAAYDILVHGVPGVFESGDVIALARLIQEHTLRVATEERVFRPGVDGDTEND